MIAAPISFSLMKALLPKHNIRPLTENDERTYFAQRGYVLKSGDGRYFSDSYEREHTLITERLRRDWCTETHSHCIMGAFSEHQLVGFVMITQYGQPEELTVEWEATWVHPRYRGTGLTKSLYEKVEEWTISQGYHYVKSFIRDDNKRWINIRRKLGFSEMGRQYVSHWADNTSGNMIIFRRNLFDPKPPTLQTQPQVLYYKRVSSKAVHMTSAKHSLCEPVSLQSTGTM